jgi:hypothetical protein
VFENKACEMCIEDLDIYKDVGDNAYTDFFFARSTARLLINSKPE